VQAANLERDVAMVSISRSMLLAASLLAFPLAGAMAQHDPSREGEGKSTGSSSTSGSNKTVSPNGGDAMKSTAPGYADKSDVAGGVGKSPGNAAATGETAKKPAQ
jgi:hypothetical protein